MLPAMNKDRYSACSTKVSLHFQTKVRRDANDILCISPGVIMGWTFGSMKDK